MLSPSARGSRLKRLFDSNAGKFSGTFHINAPGSFQPYFDCYRKWREDGLQAIRAELRRDRSVVAVTMDLKSFYHSIDPAFLTTSGFLAAIRFEETNERLLSTEENLFTKSLVRALKTWAKNVPGWEPSKPCGIPVGPSAPRVIANMLLGEFDQAVLEHVTPLYYARYVDDVFLVLPHSRELRSSRKVQELLESRISFLSSNSNGTGLLVDLPYAKQSQLEFNTEKQRTFLLDPKSGEDFLQAVTSKIDEVSSEWRLLPDLDDLERTPAARVLTAAAKPNEEAVSLRLADELSLRRYGFSLMLRSADAVVRDLPAVEWRHERSRFYEFAERHVVTPLRFFDLYDYLPRLVAIAVASGDWKDARRLVRKIKKVARELRESVSVVDHDVSSAQWLGLYRHLQRALRDAALRASAEAPTKASGGVRLDHVLEEIISIDATGDLDLIAEGYRRRPISIATFWLCFAEENFAGSLVIEGFTWAVVDGFYGPCQVIM